jgi:hypothetical protein
MFLLLFFFFLAFPLLRVFADAQKCVTDDDCEQNGRCHQQACLCSSGWTGASCGMLRLAPASHARAKLWPRAAEIAAGAASAWGFSAPLFDDADGLWHAFSTVACGRAGVVASGGGNSFIAHLTSSTAPSSGAEWSLRSAFAPQTTFGPMSARAADGTFIVIFRVNVLLEATACAGNGTDPMPPSFLAASDVPAADLVSGDPEKGTSIYVASAARAAGPWTVARVNITGAGDVHKSNPSIAQLPDGRWAMGYRYNPAGGSLNAVAVTAHGADFRGPYENVANVTAGLGGDEDPFFFATTDAATGAVVGHLLYHNRDFGYHAFGTVDGSNASSSWRVSPTHSHAFTLNVTNDDGSTTLMSRRERPALVFDAAGRPTALINGVQEEEGGGDGVGAGGGGGSCYSFEQPVVVT